MDASDRKILRADLGAQIKQIERVYAKIDDRKAGRTPADVESLSYQLHNLYSAFEELFEIVAGAFENHLEGTGAYHPELLKRMTVPIEGVRPAFVPDNLLAPFDSLRSFRHFFRHAYGQDIDPKKIQPVLEDAYALRHAAREMVDSFLSELGEG
jgi:HepT-like protein